MKPLNTQVTATKICEANMLLGETVALSSSVRQRQAAWGTDKKGLQTKEAITALSLCMSAFQKPLSAAEETKTMPSVLLGKQCVTFIRCLGRRGRELRLERGRRSSEVLSVEAVCGYCITGYGVHNETFSYSPDNNDVLIFLSIKKRVISRIKLYKCIDKDFADKASYALEHVPVWGLTSMGAAGVQAYRGHREEWLQLK